MIVSENDLELSDTQLKFIESGWGNEAAENVIVKSIVYESGDKLVNGYLAYPLKSEKKNPVVIWNRGGNLKDGLIDEFLARGIFGEIASWGYAVLATQYREEDEFGGKDVDDVLNLIKLSDEIYFCDSSRIGMEGWSRGGMMTYKVLTMTERINCAVIISGLADLFRSEENRSDLVRVYGKLFGAEDKEEFERRKKERSAVFFADRISKQSKILLIHGTADVKISFQDSIDMYNKLKSNGVFCELKLIEGGDHYLRKQRKEISKYRKDWFDKYLKTN